MRNQVDGTWFIQSLVYVVKRWATRNHLVELLQLTSNQLSKKFVTSNNEKQTCNIDLRNFNKQLFFFEQEKVTVSDSNTLPNMKMKKNKKRCSVV
jgi:hypothetical protein